MNMFQKIGCSTKRGTRQFVKQGLHSAVPEIILFHNMWNKPVSGTILVREVVSRLMAVLPASWRLSSTEEAHSPGNEGSRIDAIVELRDPTGGTQRLIIEAKRRLDPIDVQRTLEQAKKYGPEPLLVAAPYLSSRTRQLLQEQGANYLDLTGNMRLCLERPAILVQLVGAAEDPWHEKRPLDSLKGPAAARVVRAVCDYRPPYGIRELALRAGTSPASASRVADLLTREALLAKGPRGRITQVDWAKVLERWTEDYQVLKSNRAVSVLEPRSLSALPAKLRASSLRYAVTGSLAAGRLAPIAPARLGLIFVEDISAAVSALELRPTEAGQNVILLEPHDPVVFERVQTAEGVLYAAASQVAADLLTSPGRGPEEARMLMEWMKEHEGDWRN